MSEFLTLSNISFTLPNGRKLLENISLSFSDPLIGLVGNNGVGKTVLAKIAAGLIKPTTGVINSSGDVVYIPQHYLGASSDSVARVLGLIAPLKSMDAISSGAASDTDYELTENWWGIQKRLEIGKSLISWNNYLDLDRAISNFSGGEQMKLLWLSAILQSPKIYIFDEPTNHLDSQSKNKFIEWLSSTGTMTIIISHDRAILKEVKTITELSSKGVFNHSEGFDKYLLEKNLRIERITQDLMDAKKALKKEKTQKQYKLEKLHQQASRGKSKAIKRGLSKVEIGAAKNSSTSTLSGMRKQSDNRIASAKEKVSKTESELEGENITNLDLSLSANPERKVICVAERYKNKFHCNLHPSISFTLTGNQSLHIKGNNGSGKSVLLKSLSKGNDIPHCNLKVQVPFAYLDQDNTFLNDDKTVFENFYQLSGGLTNLECRSRLASLGFKNTSANLKVGTLSGGERLKVAIACRLLVIPTPQLLILDEPTNHLDLNSVFALEAALNKFKGAIVIASHDENFVDNMGITHILDIQTAKIEARSDST